MTSRDVTNSLATTRGSVSSTFQQWLASAHSDLRQARKALLGSARIKSKWEAVKAKGVDYFQGGDKADIDELLELLKSIGLFIVPRGELEAWMRLGIAKGPRWSRGALEELHRGKSDLHEHITLSYLWLLGAYEFVRTLSQRVKDDDPMTPSGVREKIQSTRNLFERVRIPLAKMEKSRRFGQEDNSIAYPGMHKKMGVAWKVNDVTWISRRRLADSLLEALELRRAEFLRWRAQRPDQGAE